MERFGRLPAITPAKKSALNSKPQRAGSRNVRGVTWMTLGSLRFV